MTLLITGGTGFIGAEIVRMLVAQGRSDIVVAHRSGNFDRIAEVLDQVETVQADLADDGAIEQLIADTQPSELFHFGATLTGPGEADPKALLQSNVSGVITLFEAARAAGTRQIIFASSIGTYGRDIKRGEPITDRSLQRPNTLYGATKVFAENLGGYYRTAHGFDFRGLRYPSIVGPGVTTPSLAQYTSWMIEAAAEGRPFEVWTGPDTIVPILHYKDAAKAAIDLAAAPIDDIKTINYLVDCAGPTPTAGQIRDAIVVRLPDAQITFEPDPEAAIALSRNLTIDDSFARAEWNWQADYDLAAMVDDIFNQVAART